MAHNETNIWQKQIQLNTERLKNILISHFFDQRKKKDEAKPRLF